MILQEEFNKNGYKDILVENVAYENEIDLEDIFDLNQKPEELLHIYISEQRDDLFFVLNGDLSEINSLCDYWDNRIRVFTIVSGKEKIIHKLKYNIVQLIVCSGKVPDKRKEGDLLISRKIIINGDMTDKNQIIIDDDEAIELPFYMISPDAFAPNEKQMRRLEQLLPDDKELLAMMEKNYRKAYKKEKKGKWEKSFEAQEYERIKEWLER